MITTFVRVSLRHFAGQKLRTLLTVSGVALGVACMVSMRLLTQAVPRAYERMVERLAGKADLQVGNGEAGVPEALLDEVRKVPGVAEAAGIVQGAVQLSSLPGEFLWVLGADLLGEQDIRDYDAVAVEGRAGDPLAFLAEPDSMALTTRFLEEHGLGVGARISVHGPNGPVELVARSALAVRRGPATLFGGRFAVMDVFAAQPLFGLDHRFTQIDVLLEEEAPIADVERALARVVGDRGTVERPEHRGETLERLLRAYRYATTLGAVLALTVGVYLVFNTMMVAVVQRRREIGVLRAVGTSRGGVVRMVLVESLAMGLAGSAIGVPLGLALASGLVPVIASDIFRNYFLPFDQAEASIRFAPVAWGVAFGLLAASVGAILPAREAVRVQPVEAFRPVEDLEERSDPYLRVAAWGGVLLVLSIVVWWMRDALPVERTLLGMTTLVGRWFGVTFMIPAVIRLLVVASAGVLGGALGFTGALAGRNLVRNLERVAVTASAFFVSLAGAITIATYFASFEYTIRRSAEAWFSNQDLAIWTSPVAGTVAREIASLPEVESVGLVRGLKVAHEGGLVALAARGVEPPDAEEARRRLRTFPILDGDPDAAIDAFSRGEAVMVNEPYSFRFGKRVGDVISLATPHGAIRLPIAAVFFDPTFGNLGVILIEREPYRRAWGDDMLNLLEPRLRPGESAAAVAQTIRERWGSRYSMFVTTLEEFRRDVEANIAASFVIPYAIMMIAFGIAVLGLLNSLFACVLDRVREIGVLRAVGATRGQVIGTVMTEAAMIGVIGALLAAVFGTLSGPSQLDIQYHGISGITVFYRFPTGAVLLGCVVGTLCAAAAGFVPARQAARMRPTEALHYE